MKIGRQMKSGALIVIAIALLAGCERAKELIEGKDSDPIPIQTQNPVTNPPSPTNDEVQNPPCPTPCQKPCCHKPPQQGDVPLTLTYNVTPDPDWNPNVEVFLYANSRRNPNLNEEDYFAVVQFPGTYPREAGQQFDYTIPNVRAGETIIVQGLMCAAGGTGDCYPSDLDNPPTCSVQVEILNNFQPSCQPVFTWTDTVVCQATCQ